MKIHRNYKKFWTISAVLVAVLLLAFGLEIFLVGKKYDELNTYFATRATVYLDLKSRDGDPTSPSYHTIYTKLTIYQVHIPIFLGRTFRY